MDTNKNKEVKQPQFVKCCSLVNFKKIVKKTFQTTTIRVLCKEKNQKLQRATIKAHRKDRITSENISLSTVTKEITETEKLEEGRKTKLSCKPEFLIFTLLVMFHHRLPIPSISLLAAQVLLNKLEYYILFSCYKCIKSNIMCSVG